MSFSRSMNKSLDLGQASIIPEKLMEGFGAVLSHPVNVPPITVCVFTGRFSQQCESVL